MKLKAITSFLLVFVSGFLFSQQEKKLLQEGNSNYQNGAYADAEKSYRSSVEKNKDYLPGSFNLGNSLFRQEKYEEAAQQFQLAAKKAESNEIQSRAYHNLGNSLFKAQQLEPSIEAYKNALKLNPQDEDTRYNLALAKRLLKQQQQQQQQQNQDQQDKNKENQDQQNNDQQQNQNNQNNQDQQQNQENKQDQDQQQNQQDQQQKGDQDQQTKPQQGEKRKSKLSEEEAKRLLEALQYQEKNTQEKLKNKRLKKGERVKIEKDW